MIDEDPEQWTQLVQHAFALRKLHFTRLAKMAFHLGATLYDAQEIATEAIMDLILRELRSDLGRIKNEKSWLKGTVLKKVADATRGRDTAYNIHELADRIEQCSFSKPECYLELSEALRVLQTMPEDLRTAVTLAAQGLSGKEIGNILGITEAAAWKRVSRGRETLREVAGNYILKQEFSQDKKGELE